MLAAYATAEGCECAIYLISGDRHVDIVGNPTTVEWGRLAIVAATLPMAAIVGWLVSRLSGSRTRTVAAAIAVGFAAVAGFIENGPPHLVGIVVLVTLVLILTGCGAGAVLGWVVRMTLSHLTAVGTMAVKALPLVMLTVLMFFNPYAWTMAATISGRRRAAISLRHRGGVRPIRDPGPGKADAAVVRHAAGRRRKAGGHARCGDPRSAGPPPAE
jgi:hypothetical protein